MANDNEEKVVDEALLEVKEAMKKLAYEQYCIKVEVLEGGTLPFKKNSKDVGFDLIATDDIVIEAGQVIKHPLNFKMELPCETWANIMSKSGLGARGLLVFAGVIDEEYRGIPHVVMTNVNHFDEPIVIKKGEKLAQMILSPHSSHFFMEQVKKISTDTTRGEGGFGSQGR